MRASALSTAGSAGEVPRSPVLDLDQEPARVGAVERTDRASVTAVF